MSFEMKYDRDGLPVKQAQPKFQEQEPNIEQIAAELQQQEPTMADLPEIEVEDQEVYQNNESDSDVEENLQTTLDQTIADEKQTKKIAQTAAQESFRAIREQKERAEKEAQEFRRLYEEEKARKIEEQEQEININDDDLVEGKTLKQYAAKIKKLEQNIKESNHKTEQIRQQQALADIDMRIKSQFPDFEKVVSSKTIQMMNQNYPELAMSLSANNDIYSKAVSAYTMIKNLGLYQEDTFVADKIRAQQNAAKPKPSSSVSPQRGDTPLSKAQDYSDGTLTQDMQKRYLEEMRAAIRNR